MVERDVLILMHGLPPRPGAPVSGMGLRAWTLGEGLRAHGFTPVYATRKADLPPVAPDRGSAPDGSPEAPHVFEDAADLARILQEVAPVVVIVEAADEACKLPEEGPPVVLDLFAPRLLERQYQDLRDDDEAIRLLDAIGRADFFLFSNPRQRDYHLGLLTAAGVDCRRLPGALVPLACPPEFPRRKTPRSPVLVSGGVFWPWHDARAPLRIVVEQLERLGTGTLHLFGGPYPIEGGDRGASLDPRDDLPDSDHLRFEGFVPYDQLIGRYAHATAALDLAAPNVERELSFSFRHVDYLRCGLPLLVGEGTEAARQLAPAGAAVAVDVTDEDALRRAVDRLVGDAQLRAGLSRSARRRARERHAWDRAVAPLAGYCARPLVRRGGRGILATAARERDLLVEELSRVTATSAELAQRCSWLQERLERCDADRRSAVEDGQRAWSHHREAVALTEEAWAAHQEMLGERDAAWQAHAEAVAQHERLQADLDHLLERLREERERLDRNEAHRDRLRQGLTEARDQIRDFEAELRRVKSQLDQTIGWRVKHALDRIRSR